MAEEDRADLVTDGQIFYVLDGTGKFLMEVPRSGGEFDYVPAEPGLSFLQLPNGKYMAQRDTAQHAIAKETDSHIRYFQNLQDAAEKDPREVNQQFRRLKALENKLNVLNIERAEVNAKIPDIRYIKDEQFLEYMQGFQKETARLGRAPRAHEWDFQPLQAYERKLKRIRPIYKGEVGMNGSDILVLEAGYGTGTLVQVSEQLEKPDAEEVSEGR